MEKIYDGIAERVSHFLTLLISFVACIGLSLFSGWKLTLIIVGYMPIIIIVNAIVSKV